MTTALKFNRPLDRTDAHENLLDNLRRCNSIETQVAVLRHYDAGIKAAERQRIRRALNDYAEGLMQQADEQREESHKLDGLANEMRSLLDLPCLNGGSDE